jgi:hypothetical protein
MPLLGVEQGFHRKKLSIENFLGMKFAAQSFTTTAKDHTV